MHSMYLSAIQTYKMSGANPTTFEISTTYLPTTPVRVFNSVEYGNRNYAISISISKSIKYQLCNININKMSIMQYQYQ
jgi:hypothetical protein